jgi:hypothetical protein
VGRDFESSGANQWLAGTPAVTAVSFSIAAWVKIEAAATMTIAGLYDTATENNFHNMSMGSTGNLRVIASSAAGGTTTGAISTTGLTAGVWGHACCTFGPTTGTDRAAYANGGGKATNTTNRAPAGIDTFAVGRHSVLTPGSYFDGIIAEVGLWNVQLTDAEVLALARGAHPLSIRSASLVGYWPLWGTSSPEVDYTRNGNDLTVNGSPAVAAHAPVAPIVRPTVWLQLAAGGTTTPQALTANVDASATVTRQVGKVMSAGADTAATVARSIGKAMTATADLAATVTKQVGKPLTAAIGAAATLTAVRVVLLALTATVRAAATVTRTVGKPLTATATAAAATTRTVGKALAASVTALADMNAMKVILLELVAAVTAAASMVRTVGKPLTATVDAAATMTRTIGKTLNAGAMAAANMTAIRAVLLTLTAAVSASASMTRTAGKTLTAGAHAAAAITRTVGKTMQAGATAAASLTAIRVVLVALTATVTVAASITRQTGKLMTAGVDVSATVAKQIAKTLVALARAAASLVALPSVAGAGVPIITRATAAIGRIGRTRSGGDTGRTRAGEEGQGETRA